MITGTTRVCGIIADPVEHSMSPVMQNFYGEATGRDLVYVPLKVAEDQVDAAVKGAYAMNFLGLNVTVPHKQRVIPCLKEIDKAAEAIGAVNTLVRIEGGFKGYNTDAAGLYRSMEEKGFQIQGASAILLGAGGAAKAAARLGAVGLPLRHTLAGEERRLRKDDGAEDHALPARAGKAHLIARLLFLHAFAPPAAAMILSYSFVYSGRSQRESSP